MRKRKNDADMKRLVDAAGLANYLSIGLTMARQVGKEAGAERRIGRLVRYDLDDIDKLVDTLAG